MTLRVSFPIPARFLEAPASTPADVEVLDATIAAATTAAADETAQTTVTLVDTAQTTVEDER